MFQSAPAITGGRCPPVLVPLCSAWPCFNPRPPLLAGDAKGYSPLTQERTVSIRARHYWRAMHPQFLHAASPNHCFNPRPPLLAGDAKIIRALPMSRAVSIRARHYWRAMPHQRRRLPAAQDVSIRARHYWRAMPPVWRVCRGTGHGFNPRPPLLAGDASMAARETPCSIVSIRARHYWRAMLPRSRPSAPHWPFQSAPAITGGRCHLVRSSKVNAARVSIRARHYWRAMRRKKCGISPPVQVSIRARHYWRAMPNHCA